ncbi:MAG: hypothetical protein BGO98_47285 [Myxococcales bacterium 68-20]|nr:MAG: hypothetical protein BGO98_47285 [Myxococcales bacterium 68-20]
MLAFGSRTFLVVSSTLVVGVALASGCAESSLDVGVRPQMDAGFAPSFTPDPDGGDASQPTSPRLLCTGTECPYPYATCPASGWSGEPPVPVYKCQHHLLSDNENCGTCGNVCPRFDTLGMTSRCVNGACEAECASPAFKDCNGRLEDGCETLILDDPKNCGQCGNECAPGVECRQGVCGCPTGMIDCDGRCVDPSTSNAHCGGCNNRCVPPDGAVPPPHSEYGCVAGQCGQLRCIDEHIAAWFDCNKDLNAPNSDGCEVDIGSRAQDPNNCGGCGIACGPEQVCRDVLGVAQCICKPGETMCGTPDYPICAELATDPEHCGACGIRCPVKDDAHQTTSCREGVCTFECASGWGDCNDNPLDGCETNLLVHGANCGACGKRCDTAAGQPCIQGVCLEVECDAGGPQ